MIDWNASSPHHGGGDGELGAIYDSLAQGILLADPQDRRFLFANLAVCQMLDYTREELLSRSVDDIHPAESLPHALKSFEAMSQRRLKTARNIPCLRKDGDIVYADVTVSHVKYQDRPCVLGFFRDVTEQKRTMELLRASEERYRLIAENVADVIWTVDFNMPDFTMPSDQANLRTLVVEILKQWKFSFISPAAERIFGYHCDEILNMPLCDIMTQASFARVRRAILEEFLPNSPRPKGVYRQRSLELELLAKNGSSRWCEVVSTYLRDDQGKPTGLLGITRDVTQRRQAERALRESEEKLRGLFENLPDLVLVVDRVARIRFTNREETDREGKTLLEIGANGLLLVAPEYREACQEALERMFAANLPQTAQFQDVFGNWWSIRLAPLADDEHVEHAMIICTDITQERLATEGIKKEQRLLRQLLEMHERERQLIAYEIHDGFAQQLTGALFRFQAFRETFAKKTTNAWTDFDAASQLLGQAIDEARRLISGLRPPILDEMGVVEAVRYLVYEHQKNDGAKIKFHHDIVCDRFAPPLENAIFRIVQESLQNACRHSHSDKIHVAVVQCGNVIHIDVRDWGIGFQSDSVKERRFGLQGIRERVRLMGGQIVIDSAPMKGTHISVELPLVNGGGERPIAENGSDDRG